MASATRTGSRTASSNLSRLWRSVPLPRLRQGTSLTIRSKLRQPAHIRLQPAWRDNGHAEFRHTFLAAPNKDQAHTRQQKAGAHDEEEPLMAEMVVLQEADCKNMIGRLASHVAIELNPVAANKDDDEKDKQVVSMDDGTAAPVVKLDDRGLAVYDTKEYMLSEEERADFYDGADDKNGNDKVDKEIPGVYLDVQMPETVNLVCDLSNGGGSITVDGKIEGNVKCHTSDGDIRVKKLRGHNIELHNESLDNLIYASSLLEAEKLAIKTRGRFRAKQIHGTRVHIDVSRPKVGEFEDATTIAPKDDATDKEDDEGSLVDVSSMFISGMGTGKGGATVEVKGEERPLHRRAIRIKSHHGPVSVATRDVPKPLETNKLTRKPYPIVEMGGVNGSCEVSIERTHVKENDDNDWTSCMVHFDSLSQDSVSLLTAERGEIAVTLDRKVEADLRLLSGADPEKLVESADVLAEEDDDQRKLLMDSLRKLPMRDREEPSTASDRLSIQTEAFTAYPKSKIRSEDFYYLEGWVENKSEEPDSRLDRKVRGGSDTSSSSGSVGKIRLDGAADQALRGFTDDNDKNEATKEPNEESKDSYLRPLIAVVGTNKIVVETVSWLGAIARRYGIEETEQNPGRTASRRGRPLAPPDDESNSAPIQ